MTYQEALYFIHSFTDLEKSPAQTLSPEGFDLRRMEWLLERLGNPHRCAPAIHIAGTKGKGSTAAMVASVLKAAGYRTGLFTSPHLVSYRERIRVNGEHIPEREVAELAAALRPEVEAVNEDGRFGTLSTFEVTTALGFSHFRDSEVDYQVLETGLGGRLDATNVVAAPVCAITRIGRDHTEILGETLEEIATEKAGIIHEGATVVSAPQEPEVEAVLEEAARERNARLIQVGRDVTWEEGPFDTKGQSLRVHGRHGSYELRIPLLGAHQLENATVAVALVEAAMDAGAEVDQEALATGLAEVFWAGRMQVLQRDPVLVLDGAHDVLSARRLREGLERHFSGARFIIVLGVLSNKDMPGIVGELLPLAHMVVATRSRNPRSLAPVRIVNEVVPRGGVAASEADSVASAVGYALAVAKREDFICVTGSLYVVGEALESLFNVVPERYYPPAPESQVLGWAG